MKTIEEFEREAGMQLNGVDDVTRKVSQEEFEKLRDTKGFTGVDYAAREEFLTANGHAVNRKNLVDANLSARPVKSSK